MIISLLILAFNIPCAFSSITALTLFEFGINRLDTGTFTLPLAPLGTASDNSETTYLYQVVAGTALTSRTIAASASGWIERFGPNTSIECKFIDPTKGECFGATTGTATGTPRPKTFEVANPTTMIVPPTTVSATIIVPTTTNIANSPQDSRSSSAGVIAGSTIAGVVVVSAVVFFILWLRGNRLRRQVLKSNLNPEDVMPHQDIYPFTVPFQSTQSNTGEIPPRRQDRIIPSSAQPQSKRALMAQELRRQHPRPDIVRRPEEHGPPVSAPPPLYAK
ncbi:hypothetical protein BDP27DRAFT_951092 [Rhodocollybia butyracea]|uniref:Uncharacterized protein n=1 Tax=Rhodocollybia butyracea TaxID=206335 RepID=A0A9P5Q5Y8_9AGAR|nr:hypothetical protein BDP27DRAFT_951092 [Rhodocollybia butyracea]